MVYGEAPRSMAAMAIGPRLRTVDHSPCLAISAVGAPPPSTASSLPPLLDASTASHRWPSSEMAQKIGTQSPPLPWRLPLPQVTAGSAMAATSERRHPPPPPPGAVGARRLSVITATSLQPPSSSPSAMNLLPEPPVNLPPSAMAAGCHCPSPPETQPLAAVIHATVHSLPPTRSHHGHRSPPNCCRPKATWLPMPAGTTASLSLPSPPPTAAMAAAGKSHCTAAHCSFFPSLIQAADRRPSSLPIQSRKMVLR